MTYQVRITRQAGEDLRGIHAYIADELHASLTADRQLDRLEQEILSLDQFPNRYRRYAKEPWHSRGLRILGVDRYLVFYIPDDNTHTVTIIRVLYGGSDVDAQIARFSE